MTQDTILIIEDNKDILSANRSLLELSGYRVITAETFASGKAAALKENPSLIILDILLPDGSGLDLCQQLRSQSDVRILFLSALNTHEDIIKGLREGGDDYLAKPYMTEELLLRVQALLRRSAHPLSSDLKQMGILEFHSASRQTFAQGTDLHLTPREYAILELLCANQEHWLSPEEIYRTVWNTEPNGDVSSVHNHIYCLRTKLRPFKIEIVSKRDVGYRIQL
jgi:DNA-binding response OmpR family regulator